MSIEVGNILEGVVTGITKFGAFVELPGGKVGLVHISEVADVYVKDVNDFLKEKNKKARAKIFDVGSVCARLVSRKAKGTKWSSFFATA